MSLDRKKLGEQLTAFCRSRIKELGEDGTIALSVVAGPDKLGKALVRMPANETDFLKAVIEFVHGGGIAESASEEKVVVPRRQSGDVLGGRFKKLNWEEGGTERHENF